MNETNSRVRISRVVFGTTWQDPDVPTSTGMFSVDALCRKYFERYAEHLAEDYARYFLNGMVATGYMVRQDDMYGVIMTPLDA